MIPEDIIIKAQRLYDFANALGYSRASAIGVCANVMAESNFNEGASEVGGTGVGLGQWTGQTIAESWQKLYNQGAVLGYTPEQCRQFDPQCDILLQGDKTGQWSDVAYTGYDSLVVSPQSLLEYKLESDLYSATMNYMAHWERPSYDPEINHKELRKQYATEFDAKITGGSGTEICYDPPIKDTNISRDSFMSEQLYGYSASRPNNYHNGLDFGSIDHPGSEMVAACNGTITHVYDGTNNGLGWWYILSDVNFNFLYWESTMSRSDILINEGDRVTQGQVLSRRTTDHLHLSVTKAIEYPLNDYLANVYVDNGMWIDPLTVLGHCFGGGDTPDPPSNVNGYINLLLMDATNGWKW